MSPHPLATWPLAPAESEAIVQVGPTLPATPADLALSLESRLGRGLVHPFRRDGKGDWANKVGREGIITFVTQILQTRSTSEFGQGELAWRQAFGSRLHLLKHAPFSAATREIARLYCLEALQRWEPRVRLTDTTVEQTQIDTGNQFIVGARFDFIDLQRGTNIFEGLEASIVV